MADLPKDAQELFNQRIPEALEKHAEKAKEINAVYLFKITGDGGGEWTVDLASPIPTCKPGAHAAAQCTIEITNADFNSVLTGGPPEQFGQRMMPMYFQGKLKVTGDPMLAMKIQKLMSI